jgi:hypothetical protein
MKIIEMVKEIDEALTFFSIDEKGGFWKGNFVSLHLDLLKAAKKDNQLFRSADLTAYIIRDILKIGDIIHRLNWYREASIKQVLLETTWEYYAIIDIEYFHIKLRSIMDYIAEIVHNATNNPGQIPGHKDYYSFEELFNWILNNPDQIESIGEDLARLVETSIWIHDLRAVRNSFVHSGGFTMAFKSPVDGILFQVYKDYFDPFEFESISGDLLMFNPNSIYFERYAAIFLSYIFVFLDRLAILIYKKYQLKNNVKGTIWRSPGFSIIVDWMEQLKEVLEKS